MPTDRQEQQTPLWPEEGGAATGPVACLGQTFPSDDARREHYLARLRQGLEELHQKLGGVPFTTVDDAVARLRSIEHWPMGDEATLRELAGRLRYAPADKDLLQRWKDQVGFPHGEIEDILRLSDPPYYTACPNPFLGEFIRCYGKPYDPEHDDYHREPFAADTSEGKTDPLYRVHSYHTKVPHRAIVPLILHYTQPGDIVLDGFCGSGMTGVAAQWCGSAPEAYRRQVEADFQARGLARPAWGPRRVVLNDLSPAATFIAANYNLPFGVREFVSAAREILDRAEQETGWMYETLHTDGKTKGRIEYTVWSEVFTCPNCAGEIVFLDQALDDQTKRVKETFPCPHCGSELAKHRMSRCYETRYDSVLQETIRVPKRRPALISYEAAGRRHEKAPDESDVALLERTEGLVYPSEVPATEIPPMHMTHQRARMDKQGVTHIHHFFLPRATQALAALWRHANAHRDARMRHMLLFLVEQAIWGMSLLSRYAPTHFSQVNQYLTGVYYISSLISEVTPWYILDGKVKRLVQAFANLSTSASNFACATQSASAILSVENSVDYIFTDPPFGENIYYADMNFLVESWHRVITNATTEAIVDRLRGKGLPEYQQLMQQCFAEYYRVLKPGRWMTVVFHNSRNAVWNAIQEAMQSAGFVVADVRTMDKQQGSYRQVTSTAVKQDLIISAYKPNGGLEQRFRLTAGTEEGAWDFVRTHLRQLPVFVASNGRAEVIAERQNYLLYDRMVAFHVQRGVTVPLSAADFYRGLKQRFAERDGMYFLPEQAAEYDQKRATVAGVAQLPLIVTGEESAVQWLRLQLERRPQTFQELHPQFLREIGGWQKHEKPLELLELLGENFLRYDGQEPVPAQVRAALAAEDPGLGELDASDPALRARARDRWYVPDPNRAADLEKLRERTLLREFEEYRQTKERRLRVFRLEAVRAGFKRAWQEKQYGTIIEVARKIPEDVLEEDPKLLMWYHQALTRTGEE